MLTLAEHYRDRLWADCQVCTLSLPWPLSPMSAQIYPGGDDNSEVLMRLLCALIRAANLRVRHVACAGPFHSLGVIWPHYMWGAFS